MLDDGTYDVFIVGANDDEHDRDAMHLTLTITSGAHKGEVVTLAARGMRRDSIDLFGLPATLFVENGVPRLEVEG